MATHKLGKLKLNWSDNGLAFRFGEGKIHRLGLGLKKGAGEADAGEYEGDYMDADAGSYADEYDQGEYARDEYEADDYSDRFGASSAERDDYDGEYYDEYDDGGYRDQYEDDYDDRYADDDPYDDDQYDDGYEDQYGDYDDDGEYGDYDDRYSDEDADGYDDMPYEDESPVMRFVNEHVWIIYILLVVLPPLGIYLLWNRGLFEKKIRLGVSAASAVIFIIYIILIISGLAGGGKETTKDPKLILATAMPTAEISATDAPEDSDTIPSFSDDLSVDDLLGATAGANTDVDIDTMLGVDPAATPLPGNNTSTNAGDASQVSSSDTVFVTASGAYYHKNRTCANIGDASVSIVTMEVATQQSKSACPLCYPNQEEYYATGGGRYYHSDPSCSGMTSASIITKEAAAAQGKTACPVCITKEVRTLSSTGLKYATSSTTDKSGMTVYATSGGKYYHVNSTCSGMTNPSSGSLLQAILAGKQACPTCCSAANKQVWCTQGGKYYHNTSNCSDMTGANKVTLAEALILGKDKCSKCWGASSSSPSQPSTESVLVYGTRNGTYYHTDASCSGMTNPNRYTLASMLQEGRPPCPKCASGSNTLVFASSGGTYYHANATCSGMSGAKSGTLAQALAMGYKRCPTCWGTANDGMNITNESSTGGNKVYCTQNGKYYHTKSNCSGMTGASYVELSTAVAAGKAACPTCVASADKIVYSTNNGRYYHMTDDCSGMTGAKARSLEEAIALGQTACPTCKQNYQNMINAQEGNQGEVSVDEIIENVGSTFKSGTSGIKVYATATSKHYHTNATCSGMTNASLITLETALNYGKTACSTCASSANTTVYAVRGGKYYHNSKTCAGEGAVSGTRAEALAYGFDACPYCVSKVQEVTSSNTYKAGTSGIKVYASVNGKYYHTDSSCAGSGASQITLETALNYGKKACSNCIGGASTTVYSSSGDKYYHSSKTCAGNGAIKGEFAEALALGKKECPVCIGGSEAYEESDIKYSAPADTKVYIDPTRDLLYYHTSSKCNDAGMSNGVGGNLEFALEWGYKACPFCNPPTSVD